MSRRSASSARAAASIRRTTREIDFRDIPEASVDQLGALRRVGQPPLGEALRPILAIRVDPGVLQPFRKEARRRKVGYQTLISDVLAQHVKKGVASGGRAARNRTS